MDQVESNPHVLMVDDDRAGRMLAVLTLEQRGFSVSEAGSGEEAIAAILLRLPDIILLDAMMPGLDGFETCRRIRKIKGAENLPIVMLSGLDDDESIQNAYDAGATDYCVKSDYWTLLAQRLRYLLRTSGMRSALEESRATEARIERIAHVGNWEWDVGGRTMIASAECFRMIGRPPTQSAVPDLLFLGHLHADDRDRVALVIQDAIDGSSVGETECRIEDAEGRVRSVRVEFEVDRDAHGKATRMHGVVQDISDRRRAEDQVLQLVNFDTVTGLSNRAHFQRKLADAIAAASPAGTLVVLACLGVERLTHINASLGRGAGDQVLQEMAVRLNRFAQQLSTDPARPALTGRLGGDRFALMVAGLDDAERMDTIVQELRGALHEPVHLSGHVCITSISSGIAGFPGDAGDAEALIGCAEIALRSAMSTGTNNVHVYQPRMNEAARRRLLLEPALHMALNRRELEMYYQPQIDTRRGEIVGAEALMRWNFEGRLVPPGEFIPIAEEIGLIIPFGEWALDEVMRQNREWIHAGAAPLTIAVNIPSSHFEKKNFVEMTKEVLRHHALDAACLELEITESSLIRDLAATMPTFNALTAMGVGLSVDDFGTGYSSLAALRRLPIDTLKIDGSFVRDLRRGSDMEAIVTAIIVMAKRLGLRVIAEGVETAEQMTLLRSYGCHLMQGYYFARPLPATAFAQFRSDYETQKTGVVRRKAVDGAGDATVAPVINMRGRPRVVPPSSVESALPLSSAAI